MIRVLLVLLAIAGIVIIAASAPRAMGARRAFHSSSTHRSFLFYQVGDCFHVAPHQWICPEPAP